MNMGFFEFGLPALLGYGFMIVYTAWYFSSGTETIQGVEEPRLGFKELTDGISMNGARLLTPEIKEETLVKS